MFNISFHATNEAFVKLRAPWESLLETAPFKNPFLRPVWYQSWLAHQKNGKSQLGIAEQNGQIVAIIPFRLENRRIGPLIIRTVEPFFGRIVDYNDVLIMPGCEETFFTIFDALRDNRGWDVMLWPDVRPGSMLDNCLRPARDKWRPGLMRQGIGCPEIRISGSYDEYLKSLSKTKKDYLNRRYRKITRDYEFRTITAEEFCSSHDWFDQCRRIEIQSFKGKQGRGILANEHTGGWISDVIRGLSAERRISFSGIADKNTLIAYTLGFREDRIEFQYSTGFLESYEKAHAGIYSHIELVKSCCTPAYSIEKVDLMRGVEPYKLWFTDSVVYNNDFYFFNNKRAKMLWRTVFAARFQMKKLRDRLFPGNRSSAASSS